MLEFTTPPTSPKSSRTSTFEAQYRPPATPARTSISQRKLRSSNSTYKPCTFSLQAAQTSPSYEPIETKIKAYFEANPDSIKYSKKHNHHGHSFIKIDEKIYSVDAKIGKGDFGYVKVITDIESKKKFAIKIMAETAENLDHYTSEKYILEKLNFLHGFIKRTFTTVDHSEQTSQNDISEKNTSDLAQFSSLSLRPVRHLSKAFVRANLSSSLSEKSESLRPVSSLQRTYSYLDLPNYASESRSASLDCWSKKPVDPKTFPSKYNTKIYFIMELHANAISFQQYLNNNRSLDLSTKLNIFLQIINKLKTLHQNDIVHNDLNAGNILIQTDSITGEILVNIIDFGCAHELNTNHIAFLRKTIDNVPEHFHEHKKSFVDAIAKLTPDHPLYSAISDIKESPNTGFCSVYSDINLLGKRFKDLFAHEADPFFNDLYAHMTQFSPFERPSLEHVEAQCQEYLKKSNSTQKTTGFRK